MFTQAGFNKDAKPTGIRALTRHVRGGKRGGKWAPAQLWRHSCGDYFWHGDGFIVWGECVVIATLMWVNWREDERLEIWPHSPYPEYDHCKIADRKEFGVVKISAP